MRNPQKGKIVSYPNFHISMVLHHGSHVLSIYFMPDTVQCNNSYCSWTVFCETDEETGSERLGDPSSSYS